MTPSEKIPFIKEKLEKTGTHRDKVHRIVKIKACQSNDRYTNKSTVGVLLNPGNNDTVNKAQLLPYTRFESRSPINAARSFIDHRSQLSHHSQQPVGSLLEEIHHKGKPQMPA
mmetsp:Transcript_21755/g.33587  ORF Transcript_21755/g.33587 Transcript_21755/m.33587 type:complete len:113 (-) Transcript_21755:464-802(-)